MSKVSNEVLQEIKKISIIEYARNVLRMSLDRKGKGYTLTNHDSVFISPDKNLWNRQSDSSKNAGGTIIDFVMYWENLDFYSAVNKLAALSDKIEKIDPQKIKPKNIDKPIENMPDMDDNVKNIYAFLIKERGISSKIVSRWIAKGYLYQSKAHKECVFVGKHNNKPLFMTKVATKKNSEGKYSKFDVEDSIKEVAIYQSNNSDKLVVCESPLDCMSYQSLLIKKGEKIEDYDYLITCGATNIIGSLNFNMAHKGSKIREIILSLDNDKAGIISMIDAMNLIKNGILKDVVDENALKVFENVNTVNVNLTNFKDWNDCLKFMNSNENYKLNIFNPISHVAYVVEGGHIEESKEIIDIIRFFDSKDSVKQEIKDYIYPTLIDNEKFNKVFVRTSFNEANTLKLNKDIAVEKSVVVFNPKIKFEKRKEEIMHEVKTR